MLIIDKLDTNYTLIKRESAVEPYVVAYGFDPKTNEWASGHYFQTVWKACDWWYWEIYMLDIDDDETDDDDDEGDRFDIGNNWYDDDIDVSSEYLARQLYKW